MAPQFDPRAIPELTPQEKRLQRILKGVVVVLTLLILVVLGFMVYKMVSGKKKPAPVPVDVAETLAPVAAGGLFGPRDIVIPAGAHLVETTTGSGIVILRLKTLDGSEQLIILDLASGSERGRFVLKPAS